MQKKNKRMGNAHAKIELSDTVFHKAKVEHLLPRQPLVVARENETVESVLQASLYNALLRLNNAENG
jgi:hypothetical protein